MDANRFLGFEDDERVFLPAACILNMLGVTNLQLLTSNPNKVQAICRYDFNVTNTIPLITEPNKYNGHYMRVNSHRSPVVRHILLFSACFSTSLGPAR
ncbi:hypothetical protein PGW94_01535 [Candidatus Anaplasma sp. TIGMIC]|nr:hypothetical protein [Candidatus Anaplasma sp. TIGMIC]MDB1135268.1 hypothetical protein [Candidatus Anaplasma sp. TIGMIC]